MLRSCVLDFKGSWVYLPLVEFACNNCYQASITMAPYEALYGRKCKIPICWNEVRERKINSMKPVEVTFKKIRIIQEKLKVAQDRQKSYANT